jgi:isocitrate lyase
MQPDDLSDVCRDYGLADVERLAGSFRIRHTLAEMGAARLRHLLNTEPFVPTLGALTGNQAVQQVKAGLKAIYLSGWQVAADANTAAQMYPDQSLYPVDSVPNVVKRINNALRRADQIARSEDEGDDTYWMAPIIADAEAGFGGALNAYELMKAMIEAGAAGVHFEDQLASEKKCGHLGGKVLVPISQHLRTLNAARLAADVEGVATVLLCRTDAQSAQLLTSDIDERDRPFISGERTAEGFFRIRPGLGVEHAIARSLAYAPYTDLLWWETSEPNLDEAKRFADAIHHEFPGKLLAYNCSQASTGARSCLPSGSRASSATSRKWATGSSSLLWPVFTVLILRCSNWPGSTASAGWRPTPNYNRRSSQRRRMVTRQPGISVRSASAISMPWLRQFPAEAPRRRR